MTDKLRAQAARFVQRFFERKDAHHEIEISGHSHNPSSIPRPDLWADIIDLFARIALAVQVICQPKIESGIIDKDHGIGKQPAVLAMANSKAAVAPDPETTGCNPPRAHSTNDCSSRFNGSSFSIATDSRVIWPLARR